MKDGLSNDAKARLKAVLAEAKSRLLPNTPVTNDELTHWIDMIYADDWQPGQFCEPGDDMGTHRSQKNSTAYIGTLIHSLEASPKSLGRGRRRGFSERNTQRNTAPRSDKWWRQQGGPVHMLVEHKAKGTIQFSLRDMKFAIINGNASVRYDCAGKADAYFLTMRKSDDFMAKIAKGYNIEQAVYICCNRLTHWSNPGVAVGQVPPKERLADALCELLLCRYSVSSTALPSF